MANLRDKYFSQQKHTICNIIITFVGVQISSNISRGNTNSTLLS